MATSKKTLFVVGAGCSKNYDCSSNGIAGLTSLTNNDLFNMARKVLCKAQVDRASQKLLEKLFKQICRQRGVPYDPNYNFLDDPAFNDLEDIMTDVEIHSTIFESRLSVRNYQHRYNVLVELITYTINRALHGPPCSLHRELAKIIQADDLILDFNYDLLLDDALRAENKLDDFGYSVHFFRVKRNGDWKKPEGNGTVKLFKLHGSFNWLKCIECSAIFLTREPNTSEERFNPSSLAELHCPRCQATKSLIRLLLPPIQTKEYNVEPYRFLWRCAAQNLKGVKRMAFLGYSFANTDFATRSLLRRISHHVSMDKLDVHFMNIDGRPETHFKEYFPRTRTPTRTTSLAEFIRYYPEW